MLMAKLIVLRLEILCGLFNKCVGASCPFGNAVRFEPKTVFLFVGLGWFSNTILVSLCSQGIPALSSCITWPVVYM